MLKPMNERASMGWLGLGLLLCPAAVSAAVATEDRFDFLSFAQMTAEQHDDDDRVSFGVDRLRLKATYRTDTLTGGLQLDLSGDDLGASQPGTLPNVIKDVWVGIPITSGQRVTLGQFKTPVGLDFNRPANDLLITKRGMEKPLVLERALGVMFSGRAPVEGLEYDIGLFDEAGRSGATADADGQAGDANAWAGRLRYSISGLSAEVSYGRTEQAGGPATSDYYLYAVGLAYALRDWTVAFEQLDGSNVLGVSGRDERVTYIHLGRRISPRLDLVARYYDGESEVNRDRTRLRNTYVGGSMRLFEGRRSEGRLQLNYLFAGGDETAYTGVGGSRSDALLLQFQWLVREG